jgi:hypothetical protein
VTYNNNKIIAQEFPSKIAKNEEMVNLREHGVRSGDI